MASIASSDTTPLTSGVPSLNRAADSTIRASATHTVPWSAHVTCTKSPGCSATSTAKTLNWSPFVVWSRIAEATNVDSPFELGRRTEKLAAFDHDAEAVGAAGHQALTLNTGFAEPLPVSLVAILLKLAGDETPGGDTGNGSH